MNVTSQTPSTQINKRRDRCCKLLPDSSCLFTPALTVLSWVFLHLLTHTEDSGSDPLNRNSCTRFEFWTLIFYSDIHELLKHKSSALCIFAELFDLSVCPNAITSMKLPATFFHLQKLQHVIVSFYLQPPVLSLPKTKGLED